MKMQFEVTGPKAFDIASESEIKIMDLLKDSKQILELRQTNRITHASKHTYINASWINTRAIIEIEGVYQN